MSLAQISVSGIGHNWQLFHRPDTAPEFDCDAIQFISPVSHVFHLLAWWFDCAPAHSSGNGPYLNPVHCVTRKQKVADANDVVAIEFERHKIGRCIKRHVTIENQHRGAPLNHGR